MRNAELMWSVETKPSPQTKLFLISLINDSMKTPKIEAFHRMIESFNQKYNLRIIPLGLNHSPIQNSAWLSRLIDADGSFYINWLFDKKGLPTNLQYYMKVLQCKKYHKTNCLFNISYFYIMQKISKFLSVPLHFLNRERKNGYLESKF